MLTYSLLDVSCSPGEIELRLSQLPPWAQKQMLSRPSVAQSVSSATAAASSAGVGGVGPPRPAATAAGTGETAAPLEGKWAQVSECVCVHVYVQCMCVCVCTAWVYLCTCTCMHWLHCTLMNDLRNCCVSSAQMLELCPIFRGKHSTFELCMHSIPIYSMNIIYTCDILC